MKVQIPFIVYSAMVVFFLTALVLGLLKQARWSKFAGLLGSVACGAGVAWLMFSEQRLPLFGAFESVMYVSFILTLFANFTLPRVEAACNQRLFIVTHGVICLLLGVQATRPMAFNADFFMYDNLWVNLFFNLRLNAAGFLIWAAILFMVGLRVCQGKDAKDRFDRATGDRLIHQGRNFLLAGIVVYLMSEWSGSLWCLNWLGETWQWSRGFLKAAIVFLLAMLASHLPLSLGGSPRAKALFGICPGIYIFFMLFQH
ncbi:MAG: hypothetical protein RBR67_05775 [Desulfobacterium sp.]|nr:hypothetical protein [Desulfobacterium sp.]